MPRCLLALGANLGDRTKTLDLALEELSAIAGVGLLARSTWHETRPAGGPPGQSNFLNGAVLLETDRSPKDLAARMHELETKLGRVRKIRWDARTVDIDILLYEGAIVETAQLQIPHPRMSVRQFVLAPAVEIAGEMVQPTLGWTLSALLHHWRVGARRVAIAGVDAGVIGWLSESLSRELNLTNRDRSDGQAVELVLMDERPAMVITVGVTKLRHSKCPTVEIVPQDREELLHESLAAISAAWPT